jgi:predicted RNase H-like HicB family nuclease
MAPDKPSMLDEPFDVHVESNRQGHTVAHIPLLPGCIVRAQSPEQALSYVEEAITLYLLWLNNHGDAPQHVPSLIRTRVFEKHKGGAASGSGSRVALLNSDRLPIDRKELEEYLQRMCFSRKDLLEITSPLTSDVLQYRKDRRQRTIREILQHIAGAEQWYLTRLIKIPRFPAQKTHLLRLHAVREATIKLLSQYDLRGSARVVEKEDEPWTLRKVLRRFLEHEREHVVEIEWRLHKMGLPAFPMWMPAEVKACELRLSEVFHF